MSKVTIIISDIENEASAIDIKYEFDPVIAQPEEGSNEEVKLTPAQTMALHMYNFLQRTVQGNDAVEIEEEQETTCCGGACHTDEGPAVISSIAIDKDDPFAGESLTPRACKVDDADCESCQ